MNEDNLKERFLTTSNQENNDEAEAGTPVKEDNVKAEAGTAYKKSHFSNFFPFLTKTSKKAPPNQHDDSRKVNIEQGKLLHLQCPHFPNIK